MQQHTKSDQQGAADVAEALKSATLADVVSGLRRIEARLAEQSAAALGREAAAGYIGVSVATLDRLSSAGKVKAVRVSEGRVCWRRVDLDKYLADLAK